MSHPAVEQFGEALIRKVREQVLLEWRMILDGRMKSVDAIRIRARISTSPADSVAVLQDLLPSIVDNVLHNLLAASEQGDKIVLATTWESSIVFVAELSDGLAGELYSEDGWISKYASGT